MIFFPLDIQYDIEPPQDIRVQCNLNEILVSVDTVHNVFNGMIYPMGLSKNSSCMTEYSHNYGPVKYRLPLRSCNTMSTQLVSVPLTINCGHWFLTKAVGFEF